MKQITKIVIIMILILFLSGVMLAQHVSANGSETDKTQQIAKKKQKQLFDEIEKKYVKEQDYSTAIEEYEKLMKEYPNTEIEKNAQYRIAGLTKFIAERIKNNSEEQEKLFNKAIERYEKFIEKYPRDENVVRGHSSLMGIYRTLKKYKEAIGQARILIKKEHEVEYKIGLHNMIVHFYISLEDFENALIEAKIFIKNYPDEIEHVKSMKKRIPDLWGIQGNYRRAIEEFQKLKEEYPEDEKLQLFINSRIQMYEKQLELEK